MYDELGESISLIYLTCKFIDLVVLNFAIIAQLLLEQCR